VGWLLVETAEKTRKHCVLMENCCYDRREMMILHLVRRGMLGELLHAECGYLHDLRSIKFSTTGEGLWRRAHAMRWPATCPRLERISARFPVQPTFRIARNLPATSCRFDIGLDGRAWPIGSPP